MSSKETPDFVTEEQLRRWAELARESLRDCGTTIRERALALAVGTLTRALGADLPAGPAGSFADRVRGLLFEVADLLIAKNLSYGDSALNPLRIFGKGDTRTLLGSRIDDKLARFQRGTFSFEGERGVVNDLIGYLVLWLLAGEGASDPGDAA